MARNDIENIDDLFSDAILGDNTPLDAYGNPFEETDDLSSSDDDFIVLDEEGATNMFDTLDDGTTTLDFDVIEEKHTEEPKVLEPPSDDFDVFDEEDDEEEVDEIEIEDRRARKSGKMVSGIDEEKEVTETKKQTRTDKTRTRASAPEPVAQRAKKERASVPDEDVTEVEVPDWVVSLRSKLLASVAHAFLLSGNVRDYMVRDITITDGIVQVLDPEFEKFDVIAEYDQAHGLSFYGDEIELEGGGFLSDLYRERFLAQMKDAQEKMSLAVTDDIPNRDPVLLFTVMSYLFDHPSEESDARILLFIDYSDFLVPDASAAQMKPEERKLAITLADIGRSQRADEAGNCLIFITDDATQLSTRIRSAESRIEHIKIPIPEYEEREDFIENVLDVEDNTLSDGTQIFEHPDSIEKSVFAVNTAGLSRMQIEDIVLRCLSEDEPLSMRIMKDRKNDIIREDYDEVLEIVDPDFGFERIGGLEPLKRMFMEEIIEPIHSRELEAVPMGIMLMGPPGTSKAQTDNCVIHTYDQGEKYVKDIVPGDKIFGLDGNPYDVLFVTVKGELEVYEVVLRDGRKIRCSGDHPFIVLEKTHNLWREKMMTPQEMIDKGVTVITPADRRRGQTTSKRARFFLPQPAVVQYPEKELPLDPYVMGCFLGDGCKNANGNFELSAADEDEETVACIAEVLGAEKYVKLGKESHSWEFYSQYSEDATKNKMLKIHDIAPEYKKLLSATYCHDKYIPREYLESSVEQRFELLRGLMDTDGCIKDSRKYKDKTPRYHMEFTTTAIQLRDDFMELVYSLGYNCSYSVTERKDTPIYEYGEDSGYEYKHDLYTIRINIPNEEKPKFFRLSRKKAIAEAAAASKSKARDYSRIPIAEVRKTGEMEGMRCIAVNSPDHLYLVNDFIPTHNTFLSKAVAHEAGMNFVALNLNRIMEKWVGSTERNLDRALDCAMAMAPTIVFIDEIDEALPNRADPNASAVNKRINQRLLTFFSDTSHRGEVMILAATNYPEKVDPAFKRAGRFDMRFPMFAPDEFDRMRIMQVIAKARGYEFSWFESPDKEVANPFANLRNWLEAGNVPLNEKFVGDRDSWSYTVKNSLNQDVKHEIFLPKKLISIIDKKKITLQQLYEAMRILFEDLPVRTPDASTGEIETDEVFFAKIKNYLEGRTDVIGSNAKNIGALMARAKRWEQIYRPFAAQTFQMTGAELDVVMNKAITLWKRWVRSHPDGVERLIAMKAIKHDKDIPWNPFLLDACRKTVNAVAGIKLMEDNALLNTSDLDFIPDAMYAETDDGRQISYHERQEELVAGQTKAQLKKDRVK